MKQRWIGLCLSLCLLALGLLSGCQAGTSVPAVAGGDDPTGSVVPGYMGAGEAVRSESDTAGVLGQIAIEQRSEKMRVVLQFEGGLPQYTVKLLDAPVRVMVALHLAEDQARGQDPEPLGTYMGLIREEDGEEITYFFQFSGLSDMKVQESGNSLEITLVTTGSSTQTRYYVMMTHADAAKPLAADNAMYPVLCDDWSTIRYISAPMMTLEEADGLLAAVNGDIEAQGLDVVAEIVVVPLGDAPAYEAEVSREALLALAEMRAADGRVIQPEIWATDARFLCYLPGNRDALFARPVEYMENGEIRTYDQVWVYRGDGTRGQFMDGDFSSVALASFSPDGDFLALIETAAGRRTAYVYGIENDALAVLSMEGFGDYTSSLCWGDDGRLYAMTGDDSIQLLYYDPGKPEGQRVDAVEEREGSFGELRWANGALFFVGNDGVIWRIDPATGERQSVFDAEGFVMSPDEEHMACMYYAADIETDAQTGLSVVRLSDGRETVIPNDQALMDASWSSDGQTLYYLVVSDSDEYPCELHAWHLTTGAQERLGSLASTSMSAGLAGRILVQAYYDRGGVSMPVTYVLTLP